MPSCLASKNIAQTDEQIKMNLQRLEAHCALLILLFIYTNKSKFTNERKKKKNNQQI